ncbi:type A chloramphenicol O-acetyltransferase [Actinopolymorpha alba]|uniref:type A chloramphenicol O-acetyltransferase n=1 Tax=Actinopolymorpha alba TaxID=533267 RepID=UPI0003691767|nr:type A chloramphenicol O-acetyltransferase [Actinopolymorpha alba]
MNRLEKIDPQTWHRREHFEHYRTRVPCTYAITTEIDVTAMRSALKRSSRKTYIAQVWALASVVNQRQEFRLSLDDDGEPAIWDGLHPAFTVFNDANETFSCVWARFDDDFGRFHDEAAELLLKHRYATSMFPQGSLPPNVFDVSSLPWTDFTGFTLQIAKGWAHFQPIFTLGRYIERAGRTLLPLAVQIHHAAADGFHTARLINDLRALVAEPDWID